MSPYTPGPWNVGIGCILRGKHAGGIGIFPEAGPAFAILPAGRRDVQAANARLITAAPDLLAALEALVERVGDGQYVSRDAMIDARAAIAKATGCVS